jgi:hypothetical protein
VGAAEVRLQRGKQRAGVVKVERIESSPALAELRTRLQGVARDGKLGAVFPNRQGNPYTSAGFAAMWGKLIREAMAGRVIEQRFTFHDLRSHYVTRHGAERGALPSLHASPTTTRPPSASSATPSAPRTACAPASPGSSASTPTAACAAPSADSRPNRAQNQPAHPRAQAPIPENSR